MNYVKPYNIDKTNFRVYNQFIKGKEIFMLLIISKSRRTARSISETFHYMSILSYAATAHEALSEISPLYRAVLIVNPEGFPDINDYVTRIKSYKSDMPVFALTESATPSYYPDVFDGVFTRPSFTPALAEKIISYANENSRARIGDYYLGGFDASSSTVGVNYFYTKVNFTKTEAMILRYLIRSYPVPQRADKIIKYAFRHSRAPEPASIRTHLSIMNKKMESCIGRRLITLEPGQGYFIMTPEYEKNKAKR